MTLGQGGTPTFDPGDDPELAALAAQRARKKRFALVLGAIGVAILFLVVSVAVKLSSDAEREQQRLSAQYAREAEQQRGKRAEEEKTRDRIGLGDFLSNAARGGNTTVNLAAIFAAEQLDGYSVEDPRPTVASLENGTIKFNGRAIPAAVIKASFVSTNRVEGRRRTVCVHAAAANDAEFKMWRQVVAKGCDQPDEQRSIEEWKTENGFAPL